MQVQRLPQSRPGTDRLGRYYTAAAIGSALVGQLDSFAPRRVIDLGAGGGTLSLAAAMRWTDSQILTVDVDARSKTALRSHPTLDYRHIHMRASALRVGLPDRVKSAVGQVDAGVCNPPFIAPRWRNEYIEILEQAGFSDLPSVTRDIEAPAIFLAQNMRILTSGASLGIILPDSLISSQRHLWFRKALLSTYRVERVVKLPRNSFAGTDALAHAVILTKNAPLKSGVELGKFNGKSFEALCKVNVLEGVDRLDVDFHLARMLRSSPHTRNLSTEGVEVRRGSIERMVSLDSRIPALHTTDICNDQLGRWIALGDRFASKAPVSANMVVAEAGDILVARVGRNLDLKIIGVRSGSAILTDCVYRLRAPSRLRKHLLQALASPEGRAWITAQAYGVSATQLTKASLLQFPI